MNDIGIFIAGAVVSILVGAGIALLLWGAVRDGQMQRSIEADRPG